MNWLKKISIITCLSCLMIAGCDKEEDDGLSPKACLLADDNYPEVGQFVTFNDCSEEAFRIEIHFGDGTFARYAPVKHSYNEEGTFFATLTAWSEAGDIKTESIQKIIVGKDTSGTGPQDTTSGSQPIACFTPGDTVVEAGSDILFLNCSLNASSFSWDFDDGSTSTAQNPTHAFAASGTYDVKLTASNANGTADTTIAVKVGERVLANVVLKNFDPLNSSGVAWDDFGFPIPGVPVEPDVYVELNSASGSSLSTEISSNLQTSALPVSWDVSSESLGLTNENWTVVIYDDEGFFGSPQEMFRWDNVNLGTLGNSGIIQLTNGNFSVDLEYTIR